MNILRGLDAMSQRFESGSVVAVGSFDGVHRGHRMIFDQMRAKALSIGGQMVVVTFDPHPRSVVRGDNRLLSTIDEKLVLMEHAGVENLVVLPFTAEFRMLSGEAFFRDMLIRRLGMRVMYAGESHHFGSDRRSGGELCALYNIEWVELARLENISSTMIRDLIERGEMARAEELLGEPYLVLEPVVEPSKLLPCK